ncbi:hypothetical protein FACS1894109_13160 [Spirochaetia bacterium]|nr:hypothetical protein FACS1894109_13160 [Spirochaetia bacterium]
MIFFKPQHRPVPAQSTRIYFIPIADLVTQRIRAEREAAFARCGIYYGDYLRQKLEAYNTGITEPANTAETAERIGQYE